jgi:carbonic anhydrase
MMKKPILMACMLFAASFANAEGAAPWSYSGDTGPEHWASLSPDYAACNGKNQSPVDLDSLIPSALKPITFAYQPGGNEIVNNGHTVQVNYAPGSSITLDNVQFELKQFHFHAPGENVIKGKSFPMEMHLVHADKDGNLAVVAVLFQEGRENKALAQIWPLMPAQAGDKKPISPSFQAASLLPVKRAYYRYNGSLTTPPCSEGVRWLVMKAPVSASKEQFDEFEHIIHHPNNRPVQRVYARPLLK